METVNTIQGQVTSTRARGPATAQLYYCDGPNKENQRYSIIKKELYIIEHNFMPQLDTLRYVIIKNVYLYGPLTRFCRL